MIVRPMIILFFIGAILVYFGISQDMKIVTGIGIGLMIIGIIGAYKGLQNKQGYGFLKRI